MFKGEPKMWWLRTPCRVTGYAAVVLNNGVLRLNGIDVRSNSGVIRPALHLNFSYLRKIKRDSDDCVMLGGRQWIVLSEETGLLLSKEAICLHRYDKK